MDHLFFYKKGVNLQNSISKIRFSYTREYTLIFSNDPKTLITQLTKYKSGLLFYFTDRLTNEERISINNLKKVYPEVKLCLCSNKAFALDAWQMYLYHFIAQPINSQDLEDGYKKYISELGGQDKEIKINTKEGLVRIPFNMINYLKASGNYTEIFLRGGKSFFETKQLQRYEYLTEVDLKMKRLHRSYIFNLANIKTVGNKQLSFYATDAALGLSISLERKIKATLLGK